MKAKVHTCLWFDGKLDEAAELYVSLIANSRIESRSPPSSQHPAFIIEFTLDGTPYSLLSGGPQFPQSECASIFVLTDDQDETDRLWTALTADGGAESKCGWLKDRFGVSWQIVPREMMKMFSASDREAAERAMSAMKSMRKIELTPMRAAFEGKVAVELTSHLFSFFPQLEGKNISVSATTVADVVAALELLAPGLKFYLCDELGRLRTHVNIFVGAERIVDREALTDRVAAGTRVLIMQALSGG